MDPYDIDSPALELLEDVCGFALGARPSGLSMLPESDELEVIAGDGSGGCFYLWHAQRRGDRTPVVYLSSYGEASRFAPDFTAALTIVTAFPGYWTDALVCALKGDGRLERAVSHYEADLDPEYSEARAELQSLLNLDLAAAPALLTAAVHAAPPFTPLLCSPAGPTPAGSFKDRPFPK